VSKGESISVNGHVVYTAPSDSIVEINHVTVSWPGTDILPVTFPVSCTLRGPDSIESDRERLVNHGED
jgi:hypothetical protein